MARFTPEEGARLRDIAYSAGVSVDRLIDMNPDLLDENQNLKKDISGIELRLGKGNKIEELQTWKPGTDKLSEEELAELTDEERERYDRQRGRRREYNQAQRAKRQEKRNERLMQDSGFAAFMRQMGFDASEIENSWLTTKENLRAQRQQQMPLFEDQRIKAEQQVNHNAEASGLFRSGQRLVDVNDATTAVDVQRQSFLDGLRETRRTARAEKNSGLARLERQRAEQEIAAAERLTTEDAQTRYGI